MKKYSIIIILLFIVVCFGQYGRIVPYGAQVQKDRTFGMGYTFRMIYLPDKAWNSRLGNDSLPKIERPLRMNGISFFGKVSPAALFGVKAFGGSLAAENSHGRSNFWTAMGGVFMEFRKENLIGNWYGSCATTMYLGRSSWTSLSNNGVGIAGHTDALYFEPSAGIGYSFDGKVEIKAYWSYVRARFASNYWSCSRDVDYKVIPEGHAVNFTFRFYIPVD